jgi:hypothetical protein
VLTRFAAIALVAAGLGAATPAVAGDLDLFVASGARAAADTAAAPSAREVTVAPAAAAALAAGSVDELRIEIAPGLTVTADRVDQGPQDGIATWAGDLGDDPFGSVDLVIRGDRVTGQVTHKGATFRIEPVGTTGRHRVKRVVEKRQTRDDVRHPPRSSFAPTRAADTAAALATTRTTVRVLVGYTPAAAAKVTDIAAEAALAIRLANSAYKRSGVLITLKLAGLRRYAYKDAKGTFNGILNQATDNTGAFKGIWKARNDTRADVVSILTGRTDYCGLAWIGPYETHAYSVVSVECITYHTFAHEIGHNFGLLHDRYVEAKASTSRYHFGFVNKKARIRDIMSYNDACYSAGFNCARVPMFSTPKIDWKQKVIGVAPGKKGAAFAARTLNEARKTVAGFR